VTKKKSPPSELLHTAIASAPIILWTADPAGIFTLFEGRGVEPLGLKPGQLVGSSLLEYFASRPEMQVQVRKALAGDAVHFESEAAGKAYEHWVEPIMDSAGRLISIVGTTIDISARYKAQEELRQSEAQFRDLAEGSVQGIVIHLNRKFLYVNRAYAELLGYATPEEVCALPSMDIVVDPAERERLRDLANRRAAGETVPEMYETVSIGKDGSRKDLLVFSQMVHWRGRPAIQSTLVDITDRKQAERALQESQLLLATVFDTIPHPAVVKDREDRYLMVNKAWSDFFGMAPATVLGVPTEAVPNRPKDELRQFAAEDRLLLSGRAPRFSVERELTARGGEKRHIQAVKVPMQGANGEVIGLVGMSIDLTDRRRAEAELREKEWMLARAARSAGIGTWFREFETGKLRWSDETFRILGLDPQSYDPSKEGYFPLIHPEDRAEYERLRAQVEHIGGTFRHEHRIIRPSGEVRVVTVFGERYYDENGKSVGVIGIFQDVTDQRSSEARLVHSEKMEVVGRLTAGVAHDFNNLLTVIRGNLEMLVRSAGEVSGIKPLAEAVLAATNRGAEMVHQLSTIARKQPLQPSMIRVGPVLAGLTSLLEGTLGSGIQVKTAIDPETWPVRVDTAQLQSAILNLAINARDAMEKGGRLTLSATNVTLSALDIEKNPDASPGDYVKITVADTGSGIPEALLGKVFEPFFTTKESGQGTGLGLSMVFGFVRQSGGYVGLKSELGSGTTVCMYFPRDYPSQDSQILSPTDSFTRSNSQ